MIITRKPLFPAHESSRPVDPRLHASREHEYSEEPRSTSFRNALDTLFPKYTSLGAYTVVYIESYNVLCARCARDYFLSHRDAVIIANTYDEGPTLYCDNCSAPIESSYGDPDDPDDPDGDI